MATKRTKTNGAGHAKPAPTSKEPKEAKAKGKASAKDARGPGSTPVAETLSAAEIAEKIVAYLKEQPVDADVLLEDLNDKMHDEHLLTAQGVLKGLEHLRDEDRIFWRTEAGQHVVSLVTPGHDLDASEDLEEGDSDEDPDEDDDIEDDDEDLEDDSDEDDDDEPVADGDGTMFRPTRYLKCPFTRDDVDAMRVGRERDDVVIEKLEQQVERLQGKVKKRKQRIDELEAKGRETSKKIRLGYEMRNVPCEERREIDTRPGARANHVVMVTYRLDTNEAIDWRELRFDERQGALFDPAAPTPAQTVIREPGGAEASAG
jgi:vacuolar-type H+-ATPase subunit I/STV1